MNDPFLDYRRRPPMEDGVFSPEEVGLANRNHGFLIETLALDVTPTGAHYLLTHFDVPMIDAAAHRLNFGAGFENPRDLTMAEIRSMPQATLPVTMECAGNGRAGIPGRNHSMPWGLGAVGTSEWTGTPLRPVIEAARPKAGTVEVSFTGADFGFDGGVAHHFGRSLTLGQIAQLDVLLVWAMNGQPLLPQHGAPLRLIVPGWYGMASVKWLARIEALTAPYQGYQQVRTYRYRQVEDEPGDPVGEIQVRSLMVPPGVPDWVSRKRFLRPGRVAISGRAWSGMGRRIAKVELGVGDEWREARLLERAGDYSWTGWCCDWDAVPGHHLLRCRATDETGAVQPLDPSWNLGGFGNNAVQRVEVTVSDAITEVP